MSERVSVTRMDHSDYGTEIRVEVLIGGKTVELICLDGDRPELELIVHGPDPGYPYAGCTKVARTDSF